MALERDSKEGKTDALKKVFDVSLDPQTMSAKKTPLVDLMHIFDPNGLAEEGLPGDVGRQPLFAMPFSSIGGLSIMDRGM